METTVTENQKNIGALIHLSTFLKYFFPLANFIVPILLWTSNKEKPFIDYHGKQAVNFQLSLFLYTLILVLACLPFILILSTDIFSLIDMIDHSSHSIRFSEIKNITGYVILFSIIGLVLFSLFIFELVTVITATLKASKGELYHYPLCIPFIKTTSLKETTEKKLEHEHTS